MKPEVRKMIEKEFESIRKYHVRNDIFRMLIGYCHALSDAGLMSQDEYGEVITKLCNWNDKVRYEEWLLSL